MFSGVIHLSDLKNAFLEFLDILCGDCKVMYLCIESHVTVHAWLIRLLLQLMSLLLTEVMAMNIIIAR